MTISIERASLDDVIHLRTKILRPHFPEGQLSTYPADAFETTHHFAARHPQHGVIACATIQLDPSPMHPEQEAVRLRGMAVSPTHRRQKIGMRLLSFAMTQVALSHSPINVLWCNAREIAVEFYQEQDFQTWGTQFTIPPIGTHIVMWRPLPSLIL